MKLITLSLIVLVLTSCAVKIYPLKGKYQDGPFMQVSNNPIDTVWDKLIDLFATKGLPIKIIDKSSGLIISDKAALLATNEDKNNKLENPGAGVVLEKVYNPGTRTFIKPGTVVGEWNVRIKANANGGTTINVNLVNLKDVYTDLKGFTNERVSKAISTGVFEKVIFDYIK